MAISNQYGATIYLSKQDIWKTIRDMEIVLLRNVCLKVSFTIFIHIFRFALIRPRRRFNKKFIPELDQIICSWDHKVIGRTGDTMNEMDFGGLELDGNYSKMKWLEMRNSFSATNVRVQIDYPNQNGA